MGLDALDMTMRIEREFEISIKDDEWRGIRTVRDVHVLILGKLGVEVGSPAWPCASFESFDRVRRTLIHDFGVNAEQLELHSRVEDLLPRDDRPVQWRRLGTALDVELPRLALSTPMAVASGICLFSPMLGAVFAIHFELGLLPFVGLVLVGIWLVRMVLQLAPNFANTVRSTFTIATLVRYVNGDRNRPMRDDNKQEFRDSVLARLRAILSEVLATPPNEIAFEARLVQDLGMD